MIRFQNKIDEMQRKLKIINDDIEEISNNQKTLYEKSKSISNINYSTTEKTKPNKSISTRVHKVNNTTGNFFRINNTKKNQENNLKVKTRAKIGYKKSAYNLINDENNSNNEKQGISNYVNKSYYINQNNKKFPINIKNIKTKNEDIVKETKKILEYNELKHTYNDFFPRKKLSYNYNYPTRNNKNNACLNINSLTTKNKDINFFNNYLKSESNKVIYTQRETNSNINNNNDSFNDIRPSPSSFNLNMQQFKKEFENQKSTNDNYAKNRVQNYNSKTYEYLLDFEENKKLNKKNSSIVNMKFKKLNEINNSQIVSDIIEITNEYTNQENKINADNILDEYKKLLRDIKVKNEFIFKMIEFYNNETNSNININDPESLLIIWNWINKRKIEEEKIKIEDEEYKNICQDIMKEYKIKNINQLKLYIHKLFKRIDKNENFLEGIKKILLP